MPTTALSTSAACAQLGGRAPDHASARAQADPMHCIVARNSVVRGPLLEKDDVEIWLADARGRQEVEALVGRMYRQRGYLSPKGQPPSTQAAVVSSTLEARHAGRTIGTLTVNLGGPQGLNAEALYPEEIGAYRENGSRVCEFTRLALDAEQCSRQALAALFHVGIIFAARLYRANDLFIEVNPRHVPFYRNKLNFEVAGAERICARVSAPAVLLHKDLQVQADEIQRYGGQRAPDNRTFYAFMLTPSEERASARRIRELLGQAA